MSKWLKGLICAGLSLMFCFTCIGYAALTDTLSIRGTAKVDIPSGLFIINVSEKSRNNVDTQTVSYMEYTTTLDSMINRSSSGAGAVTYEITVLNNTDLEYAYRGIYYQSSLSDYNGNAYVSESNSRNRIGVVCSLANAPAAQKIVAPGATMTFTVTYTVGAGRSANTNWKTLINFQFGINVDSSEKAIDIAVQKFLNILNTDSTYKTLLDAIDNKFDGYNEWTSNYIGNVTGSSSDDSMAVNTLFAGQLQIMVNGSPQDGTVLIKHENLDGNTMTGDDYVATNSSNGGVFRGYGCEMTLYLTIDPLSSAGKYVEVYAIVFTCDRDENGKIASDWYRIGDTYLGEANVVTYDGGNGTGSFVTDNWRSRYKKYQVTEGYTYTNKDGSVYTMPGYSYTINSGTSIKSIVTSADNSAINAFQLLLNDAKKLIDQLTYAGTAITIVEDAYADAARYYTLDANGNPIANEDSTRAELCPVIINLEHAIKEALKAIDNVIK